MQAISTAATGMANAASRLNASAERTAQWDAMVQESTDLAKEAVEQVSARNDFAANAAVVRTADEMTGALLDMLV